MAAISDPPNRQTRQSFATRNRKPHHIVANLNLVISVALIATTNVNPATLVVTLLRVWCLVVGFSAEFCGRRPLWNPLSWG
jgi:hypothetical protein